MIVHAHPVYSQPPPNATPFELLADDAGLGPEELRDYLRTEVERRRNGGNRGATQAAETRRNADGAETAILVA